MAGTYGKGSTVVDQGAKTHENEMKDMASESKSMSSGQGKGWHGDPKGHAEAGRKGGSK